MTMSINRYAALACVAAVALAGCDKNAVQEIAGPASGAYIRFFNFGVNAPSVNFYAGDQKVTATVTATGTESTTGVNYGGVGNAGSYSALAPAQYNLQGKIAATTDKDLAISSVNTTLELGKAYSFYQSGFYNTTTKTVDAFVIEDAIPPAIDFTVAYVRFVHAISNANPMTLYVRNTATTTTTAVGGEVAYKSAGAFTAVPPGAYDLSTRYAGSTTNAIARNGVGFAAGRVYTISARGDITVTSTTATTRPFLDNVANR